jgi:hypothetical protein
MSLVISSSNTESGWSRLFCNDAAVLHNASARLAVFGYNAFKFQRLNVGGLAAPTLLATA